MSEKFSAIIVGAGVAGLMTALELHRRELTTSIRVLDRSPEVQDLGDAFALQPSALVTMTQYPDMWEDFKKIAIDARLSLWKHTGGTPEDLFEGRVWGPTEAEWNRPGAEHAAKGFWVPWAVSRPGFVRLLLAGAERRGIKVEWGRGATAYGSDERRELAWVRTSDGETLEADIVVAADGVGTASHLAVKGFKIPAISSGFAIFRTVMPTEVAMASQTFRDNIGWKVGDRPEFRFYAGKELQVNIILSDEKVMHFLTRRDPGDAQEAWHQNVSSDKVIDAANAIAGWDPAVLAMMKQTPAEATVDWKLMWRDPHKKWTSDDGRIIQIGDAAHSFLPTSGNGATQALEDAISLPACLAHSGKKGIPQATRVCNLLRFDRCATLQKLGVYNRQSFHHLFDERFETISKEKLKHPDKIFSFGKWLWTHNAIDYVDKHYDAALDHITTGAPFQNTNLPPGYTYEPWTMAEVVEQERLGVLSDLKSQGDWS